MLKKSVVSYLLFALLLVLVPLFASSSAGAQTRRARRHTTYVKRPNFYRRHRKAVNIGAGTAAGAVVGGLIGGKKGALIGAGAGAGTGYVVTKKQRPKHYTRYYRRP